MIGLIRSQSLRLMGLPDMERCVTPLDAEAQVPEEVPRPGAVPMGGIGSLEPVNKPGSSSFLLKEAAFEEHRRCENRFGGSAYLPA